MSITNGWGQGVQNNTIEWGRGGTNASNSWGAVYPNSASGDTILNAETFSNVYSTSYDGVDDSVETDIDIDATNGVTVSLWVKAPNSGTAGGWITSRGATGGANSTLNFDIKADGRLFNRIFGSSLNTGVAGLMDGDWHHIAILINYSNGDMTFYKDGSSAGNTLTFGSTYATINFKALGRAASFYYNGFVDEFAIFKSVLSSSNIADIYNLGTPKSVEEYSPFLWWRFEEGSGTTATDSGSGSNNGTLTNGTTYSTDKP